MKALRIPYIGTARLLLLCALLTGCATVTLLAATVTLTWKCTDEYDTVKIYDGTNLVASVPGPFTSNQVGTVTVSVRPGAKVFTAKGETGGLLSVPSNTVTTNCAPNAPVLQP
jgi:hypothetical protein